MLDMFLSHFYLHRLNILMIWETRHNFVLIEKNSQLKSPAFLQRDAL